MRTSPGDSRPVSPTQEDYIRAIYLLEQAKADTGVVSIAHKLQLSKSTVSERVKELSAAGLTTTEPYAPVLLTQKGRALGKKMTYKHRLIEVFLHDTLKLPQELIHQEAERLEHAFSDEAIVRLAAFLNHPTHDPHGSPIIK